MIFYNLGELGVGQDLVQETGGPFAKGIKPDIHSNPSTLMELLEMSKSIMKNPSPVLPEKHRARRRRFAKRSMAVDAVLNMRRVIWNEIIQLGLETGDVDFRELYDSTGSATRLVCAVDREANDKIRASFDRLNEVNRSLADLRDALYRQPPKKAKKAKSS